MFKSKNNNIGKADANEKKLLKAIISSLMTVAITAFPVYDRTPGLAVWVTYE